MTAIVRLSGVLGALGVSAGAYGSHKLEASWQERGLDLDEDSIRRWHKAWNSGWVMNMAGSAATLGLSSAKLKRPIPVAALIGGGTLLFSLSTYAAAYHADRKYAMGGPVGGSAVILGWLVLALAP
jgi:uncharacterized membrane protein YgdD (TMEM256/DUF423 family)